MTPTRSCEVLIASYLEPELAERIAAAEPRARVTYEPALLPAPRHPADHTGVAPQLGEAELARWRGHLARAEVMFDFDWHDPAGIPAHCPNLRWIQATSAGIGEKMARTGLDRAPIEVSTAAGIHAVALSEFAVLGALYFVKGADRLAAWKAARHWELYATRSLAGQRALVIGLGAIGRQTAAALAGLGVEVWGMARRTPAEPVPGVARVIERAELAPALEETGILVIACPLTEQTRGLIGAPEIARLPAHAIVINIGRGPVIDEPALQDALAAGRLRGACLDVFTEEPLPPASPLWDLENVIVSPHTAALSVHENERIVELFAENLRRYLAGEELVSRIRTSVFY